MNRRDFIAASATIAGTAAMGNQGSSGKEKPAMQPIIDTHQHLWDLSKFKTNWLTPDSPLGKNYTPIEYAKAIDGLNVVKSVYMEVDVVVEQQQQEADYLLELIVSKKTPTVAAVLSGRPASDQFQKYVDQFKDLPQIKGIREVIHEKRTPKGYCLEPAFVKGVQYLGKINKSFDLCLRPGEIADAMKLVDQCKDTRFILDHCGNAPLYDEKAFATWQTDIAKIAERPNVVGKVSGIVVQCAGKKWDASILAPAVKHTIKVFGWDRVMFGGDWPVCTLAATYAEWVNALKEIVAEFSAENQNKLFHDNAARYYSI
ncbi:MAG: amidohydrolase family protein [Zavarzinella sp.]